MAAVVGRRTCSTETQSTTNSEYTLGPELGAIIVDRYEGGFDEHGCYSGQGEALFRSGNKYSGEFRRGVMDGRGRYTWFSDGTVYDGDLRNNELVGVGRYNWSDGSSYEGGVKGGLRHGHGTFTSADGTLIYEGSWYKSKRHGQGKQLYGVGTQEISSYEGEWYENCRHGRGTMTYASGNVYEGDWVEDRKEGKGVMNWVARRERYMGNWNQDLQCGYGEHVWIEERPVSSVSMDTQKQMCNVYRGEWVDGVRHGQGTFMYADGSRYTGQWYKNKKHGPAVFISDNGRVFEGLFDEDTMLGKMGQDDEHPELAAAVKLKIDDILGSGDEASRAAAVRDVERSALQINSDLKLLYKHYAKPGATAPGDRTMFTMSMGQFMTFARDCRAVAPWTPVTIGEVYRIFFRMRRQHAFELARSLEKAMTTGSSTSKGGSTSSTNGSLGVGLPETGEGEECGSTRGQSRQQAISMPSSDYETSYGIYDSRRAITFRECVEGIVRLARIVHLHTSGTLDSDTSVPCPQFGSNTTNTAAAAGGVSRSIGNAASHSVTPRAVPPARIGTAPMEGGGSLSFSGRGESTTSFINNNTDARAGAAFVPAASTNDGNKGNAARSLAQERHFQSVNTEFKQFVATYLSGLLARLSEQIAFVNAGEGGRTGGKGARKGGGSNRSVRGEGGPVVSGRGSGSSAGSKREEEEPVQAESALAGDLLEAEQEISSLYLKISGGLSVPMTLRNLLRTVRDADLTKRAKLTWQDVKMVYTQTNAALQGRGDPAAPKISVSAWQRDGGAMEATGQDTKNSVPGETVTSPSTSSATATMAGGGGLPLPDSAAVSRPGGMPFNVDFDLLDEEIMPDDFKLVVARLFELARCKSNPIPMPCAAALDETAVPEQGEGEPTGDKEEDNSALDSCGGTEEKDAGAHGPAAETSIDQPMASEDDDGQGSDPAAALGGDEERAIEEIPECLFDLKTFVSHFLQWTDEGRARRSEVVRPQHLKRVFPI